MWLNETIVQLRMSEVATDSFEYVCACVSVYNIAEEASTAVCAAEQMTWKRLSKFWDFTLTCPGFEHPQVWRLPAGWCGLISAGGKLKRSVPLPCFLNEEEKRKAEAFTLPVG